MKNTLLTLNEAIRKNEMAGDASFFETHLAEDLLFRRASGKLARKTDFIKGLAERTWEKLENSNLEVSFDNEQHPSFAVVSLIVDYAFVINENQERKQGAARNIRFFRIEDGIWKLYSWYNEAAPPTI